MNLKKRIRSKIYSTDPYADWDANLKSIFIHFVKLFLFKSLSICNKDKSLLVFVSNCGWINIPSEHALPKIKHEHPNYDSILPKFTKHGSRRNRFFEA